MKKIVKRIICLMITLWFYGMILQSSDCMSSEINTLPSSGLALPVWLFTVLNFLFFPLLAYAVIDYIVDIISTTTIKKRTL